MNKNTAKQWYLQNECFFYMWKMQMEFMFHLRHLMWSIFHIVEKNLKFQEMEIVEITHFGWFYMNMAWLVVFFTWKMKHFKHNNRI